MSASPEHGCSLGECSDAEHGSAVEWQWHRAPKVHAAFDMNTKLTIANALDHETQGTKERSLYYVVVGFALLEGNRFQTLFYR